MPIRNQWYETDGKIVVSVLLKQAKNKNCKVNIEKQRIYVTADGYEFGLDLFAPVNVERSSYKFLQSKVEITLVKDVAVRWNSLNEKLEPKPEMKAPPPMYKQNWDRMAKEAEQAEEKEAGSEGHDAVRRLFMEMYNNATPEVRRAMNKSFAESSGTELNMNWEEVSKKKVDVKAPEGTEFRTWN